MEWRYKMKDKYTVGITLTGMFSVQFGQPAGCVVFVS